MGVKSNIKKKLSTVFAPFYSGRGSILMLHRIVPGSDKPRIHNTINEISPEKLDSLLSFYNSYNIDIISLEEIPLYLKGDKTDRFVCFTFDDGFKDNLHEALPVFEKHSAPYAIYVTTGFPDYTFSIWWYLLEEVLLLNDSIKFYWGDKCYEYDVPDSTSKESVFNLLRRVIIDTPYKTQQKNIKEAFREYHLDHAKHTRRFALSWDEIKALSVHPLVTIGAHTVSHPALNQLSEDEIKEEVMRAKKRIELKIDKEVNHFSYPFGSRNEVNSREFDIVRDMGFQTATTTRWGNVFKRHLEYLECLPRIPIEPSTSIEYLAAVNSGKAQFMTGSRKRVVIH